jgi:predicted flap endonuclease-1-like 5' DNA nuclease
MSAKSLLQKIKNVFGLQTGSTESPDNSEADVTIEREPGSDDETAGSPVDGGSGDGAADSTTDDSATQPSTDEEATVDSPVDDDASDSPTVDDGSGSAASDEPVEAIKGIGPTYSDRLAGIGIETVSQLAEADPETVAEAAQTGETKAGNWIDRARTRQS